MTLGDIEARIGAIRVWAIDAEEFGKANEVEWSLWRDVLQEIAEGVDNPVELARAALDSRHVHYPRAFG
jgi:hypothetical protein